MTVRVVGQHDARTIAQLRRCIDAGGARGVLCADGHLGYAQPVGGVVAFEDAISPSGVGFDIACGNMAIRTNLTRAQVDAPKVANRIWREVSFGIGRKNDERVDHALFDDDPAWAIPEVAALKDLAVSQLGTVGSGNHYVDVFVDDEDSVWVGVHFGSRGFGHRIATHYLHAAGGKDGMEVAPAVVGAGTDLGERYILAMTLAGRYAYAGREYVARKVVREILGGEILDEVHNHHNFAWKETHFGREYWVVRKGATPAFPGQRGFVGGSMGDMSVIIRGVETDEARENLYSTVHGAGRVMSRTQAAGKAVWRNGQKVRVRGGAVNFRKVEHELADMGVELRGGGADEAPQVYRKLRTVLDAHAGTIEIERVLRPIVVVMAGEDEHDPYKD
ncbi:MAG: RtcB family protein [Phycisphaeraceae bacterium]|nr:RtcB family protein [Phycisphaeraceae bacterium]